MRINREKLGQLMGVTGDPIPWAGEGGLKPLPLKTINLIDIEQRVIDKQPDTNHAQTPDTGSCRPSRRGGH